MTKGQGMFIQFGAAE